MLIKKVCYLTENYEARVKVSVIKKTGNAAYEVVADESGYCG